MMINLIDFIIFKPSGLGSTKRNMNRTVQRPRGNSELGAKYGVTTVTELSFNGEPQDGFHPPQE